MNSNICLVINFMLMNNATRQMWTEFARLLKKYDVHLVMLSTAPASEPLPFPVIDIPFLLRDWAYQYPRVRFDGGLLAALDWELLEADRQRANGAYEASAAIPGLFACRHIMGQCLQTLDPGYVLTWDSTCPLAIITQDLCQKSGWPVQTLERGLLPDTLMIESRGIQALSDLRTHWLAREMPASAYDEAAFQRIRDYYLRRKPQKYDQPSFSGGGAQLRDELRLGDKKAVVFLGQYDPCGCAPPESQTRRGFSPVFRSTEDTLMSLSRALRSHPNIELIFKAHPLDANAYSQAADEGVRILKNVNVHALIDLADAVVAQFTTLQFEAALYDRPVVLAARSAWWGRGATYEVHRREDLEAVVFEALERRDWQSRSANARAFLTWITDAFLIRLAEDAPARRSFGEFAAYLAETSLDTRCAASVEERLQDINRTLSEWRSAPPLHAIKSEPRTAAQQQADAQARQMLQQEMERAANGLFNQATRVMTAPAIVPAPVRFQRNRPASLFSTPKS